MPGFNSWASVTADPNEPKSPKNHSKPERFRLLKPKPPLTYTFSTKPNSVNVPNGPDAVHVNGISK